MENNRDEDFEIFKNQLDIFIDQEERRVKRKMITLKNIFLWMELSSIISLATLEILNILELWIMTPDNVIRLLWGVVVCAYIGLLMIPVFLKHEIRKADQKIKIRVFELFYEKNMRKAQ